MRILITGGAGFIGSHLCDSLVDSGNDIICMDNLSTSRRKNLSRILDHSRFEFWRHDVCDPWHIDCDQIYHLACPASPVQYQRNPVRTIKTAALGTLNALECARSTGARILIASTSEVYGDPSIHPQKENYFGNVNPVGERSCYDEGKRVGEALAASWSQQYGTEVRISRIFNTYGPRLAQDDGRMISNFIIQALKGDSLTIYGDGNQTRSWCYVSDTVSGLIALMNVDSSKFDGVPVVNIGNPDEKTISIVAQSIIHLSGKMLDMQRLPGRQDDPRQRCPDIALARNALGWSPTVSLEEGLKKTYTWFKDQEKYDEDQAIEP